jgi:hypothetical protein
MMKTLVLALVALVPVEYVVDTLRSPSAAHAQTIEQANKNLNRTEHDLRIAATAASTQAAAIQQGLAAPDHSALPKGVRA